MFMLRTPSNSSKTCILIARAGDAPGRLMEEAADVAYELFSGLPGRTELGPC